MKDSIRQPPSPTWTFFEGDWHSNNVGIIGSRSHAAWLGSIVFDGARRFDGVMPDLDLHMARINVSAEQLNLLPSVSVADWIALTLEGVGRFEEATPLYIRPMYWAERSSIDGGLRIDPASTNWCLCIYEMEMPRSGVHVTTSPYRRPHPMSAPLGAKASCLYPNNIRALDEAHSRGFQNCLMCDDSGHVAELANANVFMVKNEVVFTPVPNGTFLNGLTRQRVIALLSGFGIKVVEKTLTLGDFADADEIFLTGNTAKVLPVLSFEGKTLPCGPIYRKSRDLYWNYANSTRSQVTNSECWTTQHGRGRYGIEQA